MKAISPLIASVLLIAFVMAIAAIFASFSTQTIKTGTQGTVEEADDLADIREAEIRIEEVRYDGENITGTVQNTGKTRLENITATAVGNPINQTNITDRLPPRDIARFKITNNTNTTQIQTTSQTPAATDTAQIQEQTTTTQVQRLSPNGGGGNGGNNGGTTGPTAVASDNVTQPETGDTIKFIGSESTAGDSSITSYKWDVDGDGGYEFSGVSPNVTHSYSSGSYDVELNVSDNNGFFDTDNVTVDVVDTGSSTASRSYSVAHSSAPDCSTVSYNGSGTSSDPYNVSNDYQFQCIRNDLSASYSVVNNINASKTDQWNNGQGFKVITDTNDYGSNFPSAFTGSIDGNGHYIKGIYSNEDGNQASKPYGNGIVYDLRGTVQDLNLVNIYQEDRSNVGTLANILRGSALNISVSDGTVKAEESGLGDQGVGGLVGTNTGMVEYSRFEGVVEVSSGDNIGGLVGTSFGSGNTVRYSYANATVEAGSAGGRIGGLIGFSTGSSAEIRDNYAIGTVNGGDNVGGLIGESGADTQTSYAAVDVSGASPSGGLIGNNRGGSAADSYWDVPASGQDTSADSAVGFGSVGEPAPVSNMTGTDAKSNMSQLDFQDIWEAVESGDSDTTRDGYPILQDLSREQQLKAQGIYSD